MKQALKGSVRTTQRAERPKIIQYVLFDLSGDAQN